MDYLNLIRFAPLLDPIAKALGEKHGKAIEFKCELMDDCLYIEVDGKRQGPRIDRDTFDSLWCLLEHKVGRAIS